MHRGTVTARAGETRDVVLTWHPSHRPAPEPLDVDAALARSQDWWTRWASHIDSRRAPRRRRAVAARAARAHAPRHRRHHRRSDDVAARAARRRAQLGLPVRLAAGRVADHRGAARAGLRARRRALASLAAAGDRRRSRRRADRLRHRGRARPRRARDAGAARLPGRGARPRRQRAAAQYQADVTGEVLVALFAARVAGVAESALSWPLERALLRRATRLIDEPDNGIWEIRGEPQSFTHSRAMVWAAFDRGVRSVREYHLPGPADAWARTRDALRAGIDARHVSPRGTSCSTPERMPSTHPCCCCPSSDSAARTIRACSRRSPRSSAP